MIAVAGHWEIGYATPIMEANFWNLVLRDFEVSEWYMHPVSGIRHNESVSVHLYERHTFRDILKETQVIPHLIHVYVEPEIQMKHNGIDLREFKHPENVIYIFGSAHLNPIIGNKRDEDLSVVIPTPQNKGVPWAFQCLMVILYDRFVKNGSISN